MALVVAVVAGERGGIMAILGDNEGDLPYSSIQGGGPRGMQCWELNLGLHTY